MKARINLSRLPPAWCINHSPSTRRRCSSRHDAPLRAADWLLALGPPSRARRVELGGRYSRICPSASRTMNSSGVNSADHGGGKRRALRVVRRSDLGRIYRDIESAKELGKWTLDEQHLNRCRVLSGKASLSVNTRYCTRYRCRLHMRPGYKPANWSAPRDDVWSPRMLPMPP
jgi:hypothetical protein